MIYIYKKGDKKWIWEIFQSDAQKRYDEKNTLRNSVFLWYSDLEDFLWEWKEI